MPHVTQALTGSLGAGGADDNRAQCGFYVPEIVSQAMSCKWAKGTSGPAGDEHHNLICAPLTAKPCADHESRESKLVVAIRTAQTSSNGWGVAEDGTAYTLDGTQGQAIAFTERGRDAGRTLEYQPELAYCLTNPGSGGRTHSRQIMTPEMRVRRLTPRECERLQGFPDDYTNITYRGKAAADSPRYKALGNSMAVPVMHWIGERIEAVENSLPAGWRPL